MPTSATESDKLLEITLRRMKPADALEYARELNNELGSITENGSLRVTLKMALERAERIANPPPPVSMFGNFLWVSWVVIHFVFIGGMFVSGVTLALCTLFSWQIPNIVIAWPLIGWIVWAGTTSTGDCVLTVIENWIRKKHQRPPIKAFLGHYVAGPIRSWRHNNGKHTT